MAKKSLLQTAILLWIASAILIALSIERSITWTPLAFAHVLSPSFSQSSTPFDFGDQIIELDHKWLHFTNGLYRGPGGQHTAHFINRSVNRMGTKAAAILIDNPPGSGIFYYAVGAVRTDGSERYSMPVFLGDRVKIESVSVGEETVTIRYLTHSAIAPLGIPPTEPVTVTYIFQTDGNLRAAH